MPRAHTTAEWVYDARFGEFEFPGRGRNEPDDDVTQMHVNVSGTRAMRSVEKCTVRCNRCRTRGNENGETKRPKR